MDPSSDLAAARRRMINSHLKGRGITSTRVLTAMELVPRERFVASALEREAYADRALAIDCGQTISQPYIVALMTEALQLTGTEHVLEVGTGSGYQTAILAELAGEIVTIERHEHLSLQASRLLWDLCYRNVEFIVGDGTLGHPPRAPYDSILVTAAAARCPPALLEQLNEGGILVAPIGPGGSQTLQTIRKIAGQPQATSLTSCRFVPLIGSQGESD